MEPKQIKKVIFILADRTYKMSSYQICSYRSTSNLYAVVLPYLTQVRHASKKVKQSHYRPGQALTVPGG